MLQVQDLSLAINDVSLASNISFTVPPGQLACLSGPSGLGKTTLLRTIAGLHQLRQGSITLNEVCFVQSGKELVPCQHRRVGYAPQEPTLYPHMTVAGNLGFFLKDLKPEAKQQQVMEMLELLEIGDKADNYPHQLSGGQAQRTAIARAMLNDPQILLLDETLNGVHTELAVKIGKIIANTIEAKRIPGILVSHDTKLSQELSSLCGEFSKQGIIWNSPA